MITIITDGKAIATRIKAFAKLTATYNAEAHTLAVNAVYHAANSGRPDVLQSFYNALSAAYQGSFRLWLGKRGIDVAGWITFSEKKGFGIVNGKQAERDAFKELAPTLDRPFWDIDANPNKASLDDKAILGRIMGLLKAVNSDDASVLPETKAIVYGMAKEAANKLKMVEGNTKLSQLVLDYAPAKGKGLKVEATQTAPAH